MSTKMVNTTCHLIAQKTPECTKMSIYFQNFSGGPDFCWDPADMPTPLLFYYNSHTGSSNLTVLRKSLCKLKPEVKSNPNWRPPNRKYLYLSL